MEKITYHTDTEYKDYSIKKLSTGMERNHTKRMTNIFEQILQYSKMKDTNPRRYQVRNNYEARKVHIYASSLGLKTNSVSGDLTQNILVSMSIHAPDKRMMCEGSGCPCHSYKYKNKIEKKVNVKYVEVKK